jgi:hypothetical protein
MIVLERNDGTCFYIRVGSPLKSEPTMKAAEELERAINTARGAGGDPGSR